MYIFSDAHVDHHLRSVCEWAHQKSFPRESGWQTMQPYDMMMLFYYSNTSERENILQFELQFLTKTC